MGQVSRRRASEIMKRFDTDGDGSLDYGELSTLLLSCTSDTPSNENPTSPRPVSEGMPSPRRSEASTRSTSRLDKPWSANPGPLVVTVWDAKVEAFLGDVPTHCGGVALSVKSCLDSGGTAELTRTSNTIDVKLIMGEVV